MNKCNNNEYTAVKSIEEHEVSLVTVHKYV